MWGTVIYDWAQEAAAEKTAACPRFSWRAAILFAPKIWVKCKLIQAIPDNNYRPTYVCVQQSRREFNKTWMCLHCSPRPSQPTAVINKGHGVHRGCRCFNFTLSLWTETEQFMIVIFSFNFSFIWIKSECSQEFNSAKQVIEVFVGLSVISVKYLNVSDSFSSKTYIDIVSIWSTISNTNVILIG